MNEVTLVKLGGGLVAPKDWDSETIDEGVLSQLAREIAEVAGQGIKVVVAVGSGNFGHAAVKKWGMESHLAAARVQCVAGKIGERVVESLLGEDVPAVKVAPHDIWMTEAGKIVSDNSAAVVKLLEANLTPVLYGDVVWDSEKGAVIFSGEKCLSNLALSLVGSGWQVKQVVQVGKEEGVWDQNRKIIARIDSRNWNKIRRLVGGSEGVDYTGGMLHKVEESLVLAAKFDIETKIVSGVVPERLKRAVFGMEVPGTVIGK